MDQAIHAEIHRPSPQYDVQPVVHSSGDVVVQADFADFTDPADYKKRHVVDTMASGIAYESWIKKHFTSYQIQSCTTTILYLPRSSAVQDVMDAVLTLDGVMSRGHTGVLATKLKVNVDGHLSGHMWVLLSSSRLANYAIQVLDESQLKS